ncbi:MAG: hypothetical protein RL641_899 [Candidatus Parcubacteria bacterium]|jgi:3-dehydroquinate synthase
METDLLQQIQEKSLLIDWSNKEINISTPVVIHFPVPSNHPRYSKIKSYRLIVMKIKNYPLSETDLIICDEQLKQYLPEKVANFPHIIFIEAVEYKTKIMSEVSMLQKTISDKNYKRIVAIGGGIIANIASFLAEKIHIDLVHVPTTPISMSDASIGGKVRVNDIQGNIFVKHVYKSFYEPSEIILDAQFLNHLSDEQIRIGLAEVIKHALYQSPLLIQYILSDIFQPFTNKDSLLRAILWTADLKRICLEVDPEESLNGSYKILRAAHDISDKLEEQSGFMLQHGMAVEKAMTEDIKSDIEKSELLVKIYQKLGIDSPASN